MHNNQTSVAKYRPNLPAALLSKNKLDINISLREYKENNGAIKYSNLFTIPHESRLPEMAKKDYNQTAIMLSVGLTMAFETMNLSRPMNANQIADLAEMILESSHEDNLALEDVILFLQKLTFGEYGKLYESMDIPKFMDLFEKYREERFQALRQLQEEQHAQHKAAMPSFDRLLTLRDLLPKNENY